MDSETQARHERLDAWDKASNKLYLHFRFIFFLRALGISAPAHFDKFKASKWRAMMED